MALMDAQMRVHLTNTTTRELREEAAALREEHKELQAGLRDAEKRLAEQTASHESMMGVTGALVQVLPSPKYVCSSAS